MLILAATSVAAIALATFSLGAFVPNATKIGLYVLESLVLVVAGRRGNDRYLRWAGTTIFVLCGWVLLGDILIRRPAAALSVAFDAIVWLAVYAYLVVDKTPLYVRASDHADVNADIVSAALRGACWTLIPRGLIDLNGSCPWSRPWA